jgi:hypothetical protein
MELTAEQERAIQNGQAVAVTVGIAECVVLRKDIYERGEQLDYSPWTKEEMDWVASETADLLAGDGFDLLHAAVIDDRGPAYGKDR